MDNIIGKPHTLKQVNRSVVRKVIRELGSATRAEIVDATQISVTTVRTLLTEMLHNNEITDVGLDESIGGRKAVRYELNKDRFFGVALCLDHEIIHYLIVNVCGEIHTKGSFPADGDCFKAICAFLDQLVVTTEIRSIGLGVPGIVNGLEYQSANAEGNLESHPIGEQIHQRYGIPVLLENDLNAITLGFGRCYSKEYQGEDCEDIHMAYLSFGKNCLSAGFLSGGRLLRGFHNFAGELGLFPIEENKTLEELLAAPMKDSQFAGIAAKVIAAICCVLNPRYVAIGGSGLKKDCIPLITESFYGILPDRMATEILFAEDKWHDYYEGMAYLTAEQIFADVRLVRK